MPIQTPCFVDQNVPESKPSGKDETYTAEDCKWLLNRFTAPEWTVERYGSSSPLRNPEGISTTLRHTNGSLLRCIPKKSNEHLNGKDVHRIYLNDKGSGEGTQAVVLDTNSSDVYTPKEVVSQGVYNRGRNHKHETRVIPWDRYENQSDHPDPNLHNNLKICSLSYLKSNENGFDRLPHTVKNWPDVFLTLFGAAQTVTVKYKSQSRITDFG